MTIEQMCIIEIAVLNAYDFFSGPLSAAQEELEDYGYSWDEECERYALKVLESIGECA